MPKHRVKFDSYKQAGRQLDHIVNEAVAYIRKVNDDASLHADKRARMKAEALGQTRDRIGEVLLGVKKRYAEDLERSQARPLPKVHAGNVALQTYWRQAAKDIFAGAPAPSVPALLKNALLDDPGDVARAELVAAAETAIDGAPWGTRDEFNVVRDRFSTDEERAQRNDHRAADAAGFRIGLLDQHVMRTLDDLTALAQPPARDTFEMPGGLVIENISNPATGWHPQVVIDPGLFGKWSSNLEKDADAAVEAPPALATASPGE